MLDKADKILTSFYDVFHTVWHFTLITVSGRHINVSNIVSALILFIVGINYSKNITLLIKTYIRNKLGNDQNAVSILEKALISLAFIVFILTVLEIANIPISSFAFIGGTLAIGIGFGAQTIIANFISGLIIMIEQSVKIGDLVEIEGVIGIVTSIGSRCVTITTLSNVEVLVPNNKLIQNSLINWTLTDNIIKYQLELKVFKNSKKDIIPSHMITILEDMLKNQRFILTDYTPQVFLTELDENAFIFLLTFHFDLKKFQVEEYIKNSINSSLFNVLNGYYFSVHYPKIVEITQSKESSQEKR